MLLALTDTFPDLRLSWTTAQGVAELVDAYAQHGLTYQDFMSSRYVRLRRISELLAAGQLDQMLRRVGPGSSGQPATADDDGLITTSNQTA